VNPVVRPRVRNIRQYDAPWGPQSVRRDKQRNITGNPVTSEDSWLGNGCFPTAMTIVMNWWANYHSPTKGAVTFPKGTAPADGADFTPTQFCKMTGGDEYADCDSSKISDADYQKRGFNNPDHVEYKVNAANVIAGIANTYAPGGPESVKMQRVRFALPSSADDKTSLIKQYLHYGPVMVMISYPGHWVVIDAYVDNNIYICDPGAVMSPDPKARYYSKGGTPVPTGDLPSGASDHQAYYIIDATATMVSKKGKSLGKWLDLLRTMDVIYVPDPADPGNPSDKTYVIKPYYPHPEFDISAPMNQDDVSAATSTAAPAPQDPATPPTDPGSQAGDSPPDGGADATTQ
jgi:hypothetical protein